MVTATAIATATGEDGASIRRKEDKEDRQGRWGR
jgi:hypothetical protein